MSSPYLRTQAIILKRKPYSEYHQLISFFSPLLGLQDASVKGSRKIESRYTGHLEILNICELQLYKKQQHFTVVQCQTTRNNSLFQQSLEHSSLGWLMVEIINTLGKTAHNTQEIYNLIEETIRALENTKPLPIIGQSFILKMLHINGFLTDLSRCGECEIQGSDKEAVYLNEQRFLCLPCLNKIPKNEDFSFITLNWKLLEELKALTSTPYHELNLSPRNNNDEKILSTIINILLENTFEKRLVSEKLNLPMKLPTFSQE